MTSESFDVVVVGGGLVGATLIHTCAKSRMRMAWVDQHPNSRAQMDPRSTALAYASQRLLAELDLWCDIAPDASAIETVHVSQQHHFGSVTLNAADMGLPALGFMVPNRALGFALSARIATRTDLEVFAPDTVTGLVACESWCEVQLASGASLRAKLVVAADGEHSQLREFAGVGLRREVAFGQHAVVAEIGGGGWRSGWAWERFCNYGPLALLPLGEDRLSLVYTVPDDSVERVLSLDDTAFLNEIRARAGFVGSLVSVSERASFPLVAIEAEASWCDRLVLVGNAARTLHPVAGQGFNLALRDALTLAELLNALAPGVDPASPEIAARYVHLRRMDQSATAAGTELLARVFRGGSGLRGHLRGAGLLLIDRLTPLRRRLARQFMGLGGRLPRP